ncbi:PAAR domain-containing protein [Massilia rubra]|uniref:Tox-PAAR-like domain-containing protein n=1 Tax=Massilia rubra TaxID=2607910 RepID=A0ABX0LK11_9BURK|nr:PAAR domain-containing protein [Massilia rubra]NHZ32775.1 hypothetical protein [Massilia rubra]
MPQAARLGDLIGHTPPADSSTGGASGGAGGSGGDITGKITGPCSGNVFTNGIKAARAHVDVAVCSKHSQAPLKIITGSPTVFINGLPAARVSDKIECGAFIVEGSGNVFIGGGAVQTDPVIADAEVVPGIQSALMLTLTSAATAVSGALDATAKKLLDSGLGRSVTAALMPGWMENAARGAGMSAQENSARYNPANGYPVPQVNVKKGAEKPIALTSKDQVVGQGGFRIKFNAGVPQDLVDAVSKNLGTLESTLPQLSKRFTAMNKSQAGPNVTVMSVEEHNNVYLPKYTKDGKQAVWQLKPLSSDTTLMWTLHNDIVVVNTKVASAVQPLPGDWASSFGHELLHEWQWESHQMPEMAKPEIDAYQWQIDNNGKFGEQKVFSDDALKESLDNYKKGKHPSAVPNKRTPPPVGKK